MLKIQDLSIIYANGVRPISNTNLALEAGKLYGILGPSGAGKSSFLKGILSLIPSTGKVTINDEPIKSWSKKIAYIEQKQNLDQTFPITVFQCVLMGTYPKLGFFHRPKKKEKDAVLEAINYVGLKAFKDRQIGELSGGQFQRVLIARAIVQNADILFLDEPFVGIDIKNEVMIIQLLKKMVQKGKTVFVVHHNLNNVKDYFDQVILINGGIIASGKTTEVFTKKNIVKTFQLFNEMDEFEQLFNSPEIIEE